MATLINETLIDAEKAWRAKDPAWTRQIQEWEKWKKQAKDRERLASRQTKQRKDPNDLPEDGSACWQSSFDPTDPSQHFSFADYHKYSKSELAEDIEDMTGWVQPWALEALRRGIAVHHSGMNKQYRGLVEGSVVLYIYSSNYLLNVYYSLFRRGFLRVVIATGTLALGINAPAKTTVFCGDSPFLTALMVSDIWNLITTLAKSCQYRQCAGRAGRRGFDLLGKVVFYGISMDRVHRLVLSRLPTIQGSFPLTSTLNLRLFNLLHGSNYAEVATRTVNSIMSLSRISLGSHIGQQQMLHHMRFSIEYLRRSRLLDEQGRPMNLFAIAAHLYVSSIFLIRLHGLTKSGSIPSQATWLSSHSYVTVSCTNYPGRTIQMLKESLSCSCAISLVAVIFQRR
jgi:ATP-dependent RNA helicase DDX60